MSAHVLVYGGSGALGRAIVSHFRQAKWTVTSVDFRANEEASNNIVLIPNQPLEKAGSDLLGSVASLLSGVKLDAVLNVAGGWAGGNLQDAELFKVVSLMQAQSVDTSVIAARLAALHLKEGGLLTLVGANAALGPTSGMCTISSNLQQRREVAYPQEPKLLDYSRDADAIEELLVVGLGLGVELVDIGVRTGEAPNGKAMTFMHVWPDWGDLLPHAPITIKCIEAAAMALGDTTDMSTLAIKVPDAQSKADRYFAPAIYTDPP
ncbi:hypothetical protein HK097_009254 [Rhizophlyctis rosea]|uniref:NAD-dependent epimerase/dehydratase domain-containing protein n=1 Tax=Rhizophlyctis rosea TaxID=64517 RepID=A0AAD5SN12_9FUNG|nr:hypothetical protein HK097_009254 [Rhizophlyctis rosea]